MDRNSAPRTELGETLPILIGEFYFVGLFAYDFVHIGYIAEELVLYFGYNGK